MAINLQQALAIQRKMMMQGRYRDSCEVRMPRMTEKQARAWQNGQKPSKQKSNSCK
jgi:hypothetical protein